jgi:uncharacterized protein GlcG (DUF336 family)
MKLSFSVAAFAFGIAATSAFADDQQQCAIPKHDVQQIQSQLAVVVHLENGGIFTPNRMWSAVVDRQGVLCDVKKIGDAWPGSRVIAIAKAGTANDFSNDAMALSTANLFAATQPGGSLYGLDAQTHSIRLIWRKEQVLTRLLAASLHSGAAYHCTWVVRSSAG